MQLNYLLILIFSLHSCYLYAQDFHCGTDAPSSFQLLQYQQQAKQMKKYSLGAKNEKVYVPVKIHINQKADGTGGISMEVIRSNFEHANEVFSAIGVEFVICGSPNYLNHANWYNNGVFTTVSVSSLLNSADYPNHINIYYNRSIKTSDNAFCGFAYFPYGEERIFMDSDCSRESEAVLVHELGHYFYLFHTHGLNNNERTEELVNGSNCSSTGDNICDTPADPNLSRNVTPLCRYTAFEQDVNGDIYEPMVENYMSYSLYKCMNIFTEEQLQAANFFKDFARRNILLVDPPNSVYFEGLPKEVNVNDLPFLLQTYPEGGTLTGKGIVDGYFDPILSGPGTFPITYQYNEPFPERTIPDQSQQMAMGKEPLEEIQWQSFKPSMSGVISKMEVLLSSENKNQITYSIRNGLGIEGDLLFEGILEVNPTMGDEWQTLFFETPIPIQAGLSYTISLQSLSNNSPIYWLRALWKNVEQDVFLEDLPWHQREQEVRDPYDRGQSTNSFTDDFCFVSYITTNVPSCGGEVFKSYEQIVKVKGQLPENGRIVPNPVRDVLKINYRVTEPLEVGIKMFDIHGKVIYETAYWVEKLGRNIDEINVSSLPKGIYICQMYFGEEEKIRRVVIGH